MYAKKLTKEELMENGITEVTKTGRIFKNDEEVNCTIDKSTGYFMYRIYDKDEEGNKIKIPKSEDAKDYEYTYKYRAIGLHRIMWAWHYGEVPEGMIVDHKNNSHDHIEDYHLDNLQLLTPGENIAKERDNWHVWELKCKLNKPRSFYENKLKGYEMAYEQAKKDHDAKGAHQLRSNISQTRARLRYYDSHITEVTSIKEAKEVEEAHKREYHERAQKKRELKANIDSTRDYYKKLREVYGKDDPYVQKVWGEWKLAIAMYQGFCKECKTNK